MNLNPSLVLLVVSGILISFQVVNIRKHYLSVNSKVIENQYLVLLPITIINITLIILSLVFGLYNDMIYSFAILIGMSIGLIGDFNNRSINSGTRGFVLGSIIFIITYLCYSVALLSTSGGFLIPLDLVIISFALLSYCFLVLSSCGATYFQHLGKFRLITNFYPVVLLFLFSRA
ncbi:MAG: lysoplasmalogenase family protein, partial [Promethearchaeota archaeon]